MPRHPVKLPEELDLFGVIEHHQTILEFAAFLVRCPAQDDDALVGPIEERPKCPPAEVRMNRDGISAQMVESRPHIAQVGVVDVAALGIEDDRHLWRCLVEVPNGELEVEHRPVTLVEGTIRLIGRNQVTRRIDDGAIEAEGPVMRFIERFTLDWQREIVRRNLGDIGIETDTESLAFGKARPEQVHEMTTGHGTPLS